MKRGKGPDPSKPRSPDRRELDEVEAREKIRQAVRPPVSREGPAFAELGVMSNYSFLHGASHPSDIVAQANHLGLRAIGIADRNSVAGVVRAYVALRDAPDKARAAIIKEKKERGESVELTAQEEAACHTDLRLVVGARLVFVDGTPDILAYPKSRFGWGRLTRLLTKGNMEAVKGDCILTFGDLLSHLDDLLLIVLPLSTARPQEVHKAPPAYPSGDEVVSISHLKLVPPASPPTWQDALRLLHDKAPGCVWLGLTLRYHGRDRRHATAIQQTAREVGVPVIATNDVLYAEATSRPLQDVLSCIRDGVTLKQAGRRLEAHAERHLKSPQEMARLYAMTSQIGNGIGAALMQKSIDLCKNRNTFGSCSAEWFSLYQKE